jgi:putative transposase
MVVQEIGENLLGRKGAEEQSIGILKRVEAGQPITDGCRETGMSDGTYYCWKAQYGGLEVRQVRQVRRLRQLEEENRTLKQVVADLTLDNRAWKDSASKTWERPQHGVQPCSRAAVG